MVPRLCCTQVYLLVFLLFIPYLPLLKIGSEKGISLHILFQCPSLPRGIPLLSKMMNSKTIYQIQIPILRYVYASENLLTSLAGYLTATSQTICPDPCSSSFLPSQPLFLSPPFQVTQFGNHRYIQGSFHFLPLHIQSVTQYQDSPPFIYVVLMGPKHRHKSNSHDLSKCC